MLYIYALPKALSEYRDISFEGRVGYRDHSVPVAPTDVTPEFVNSLGILVRRLASSTPARRVPSAQECRFCDIPPQECPDRVLEGQQEEGLTEDF